MRILYLSLSYVPSRRANSVQVMRMCGALARAGHRVELVTKRSPRRQEAEVSDPFEFYGESPSFTLNPVGHPAVRGGGRVFAWRLSRLLARRGGEFDLIYCRHLAAAADAARRNYPTLFEAHGPPNSPSSLRTWRRLIEAPGLRRIVVISHALQRILKEKGVLPPEIDVQVAHDAADLPTTEQVTQPAPMRSRPGRTSIGYVGHLYGGRGVELIVDLGRRLPGCDFHLVGGRAKEIESWISAELPENIYFHGFQPPASLPAWYASFDLLLMPYQRRVGLGSSATDTVSWMSPMKLFEYMASGKPILSSDLPVLREILVPDMTALLLPPEDVGAWAEAIERLVSQPSLASRIGAEARRQLMAKHTWTHRVAEVLDGL